MAGIKSSIFETDDGVHLNVKVLGGDDPKKPLLIAHRPSSVRSNLCPVALLGLFYGAPGFSTLSEPENSFGFLSDIFRVLVFDARGSGVSDHKGPYTNDRWIQDVELLRIWAGADKFVLAGGSYGGCIALYYATIHGDRLLGLILRDTWINGVLVTLHAFSSILTSDRLNVDVTRQVRCWSGTLIDDADFEAAVNEILPIYAPPKDVSASVSNMDDPEPKKFEGAVVSPGRRVYNAAAQNAAFSANVPCFDVRDQLKDIKAPTLIVVGRHDTLCPPSFSEEMKANIPHSRLEIFEHSGHGPPSDERELFRERVLDFIKTDLRV